MLASLLLRICVSSSIFRCASAAACADLRLSDRRVAVSSMISRFCCSSAASCCCSCAFEARSAEISSVTASSLGRDQSAHPDRAQEAAAGPRPASQMRDARIAGTASGASGRRRTRGGSRSSNGRQGATAEYASVLSLTCFLRSLGVHESQSATIILPDIRYLRREMQYDSHHPPHKIVSSTHMVVTMHFILR
jgi:hypothetical protein